MIHPMVRQPLTIPDYGEFNARERRFELRRVFLREPDRLVAHEGALHIDIQKALDYVGLF